MLVFLSIRTGFFRPGRGPNTLFAEVAKWPPMDRLVQVDIVKCFDRIDRDHLIIELGFQGRGNCQIH